MRTYVRDSATLERFEADASLDELQVTTAAFGVMARSPASEDAWATLTSIVRAKD